MVAGWLAAGCCCLDCFCCCSGGRGEEHAPRSARVRESEGRCSPSLNVERLTKKMIFFLVHNVPRKKRGKREPLLAAPLPRSYRPWPSIRRSLRRLLRPWARPAVRFWNAIETRKTASSLFRLIFLAVAAAASSFFLPPSRSHSFLAASHQFKTLSASFRAPSCPSRDGGFCEPQQARAFRFDDDAVPPPSARRRFRLGSDHYRLRCRCPRQAR